MSQKITSAGIFDLPKADYHADPCEPASLSSTGARKIMSECPAKFWHDRNHPPAPTDALNIGDAAHEWLLEGDTWPQRHGVLPEDHNGRTKEGKEQIAAIESRGKHPLKFADFEKIKAMVTALRTGPFGMAFTNGDAEKSLFWKDPATGIMCRCRPDWMPKRGTIYPDYKTARSCRPEDLERAMWDYGYHQQAEWYETGLKALGICERPRLLFIAQEKEPPFLVTPFLPDDDAIAWASLQNRKARDIFARCLDSGHWPGYADDVISVSLPGWITKQLQEQHEAGKFEIAQRFQAPLTSIAAE